jgi:hypothetical protein
MAISAPGAANPVTSTLRPSPSIGVDATLTDTGVGEEVAVEVDVAVVVLVGVVLGVLVAVEVAVGVTVGVAVGGGKTTTYEANRA